MRLAISCSSTWDWAWKRIGRLQRKKSSNTKSLCGMWGLPTMSEEDWQSTSKLSMHPSSSMAWTRQKRPCHSRWMKLPCAKTLQQQGVQRKCASMLWTWCFNRTVGESDFNSVFMAVFFMGVLATCTWCLRTCESMLRKLLAFWMMCWETSRHRLKC